MDRAASWATRIHHEAQLHPDNSFLTLTYRDECLPENRSVSIREVQLFMKRLRKAVGRLRYFACGEYGADGGRPHYHVLVFGHAFLADRVPWRKSATGHVLYRSPLLEKLWPYGHCEIGSLTHDSAGYVARYCLKKVNGDAAPAHYSRTNLATGEVWQVEPEFICMSTKPGIGAGWFELYKGDAFPSDFCTVDGQKVAVPRYYKKKLTEKETLAVNARRKVAAFRHASNNTPERLETREEVARLKADRLTRELESTQ